MTATDARMSAAPSDHRQRDVLAQHEPAYANPVVAVFLGWFVLGEDITLTMIVGAALILASVAVIVRRQRPVTPDTRARAEPDGTAAVRHGHRPG